MTVRDTAPAGSPCWADLWTSDVDGSRRFYGELLGWEAEDLNPEFGGYFNFTLDGVGIAGCMGDMGPDMKANDTWKCYLTTDDVERTAKEAEAAGATVHFPPMAVADLGTQTVLTDPLGAEVGVWQPGTFPGFTRLDEHGAPSWFELFTRDHARTMAFYRSVFGWSTRAESDTDEFRYQVLLDPSGGGELAGVMDASGFLPEGTPAQWSIYWHVDDLSAAVAKVKDLGGAVVQGPDDTPYGQLVEVTDPAGARFKLRTPPS